MLLNHGCSNILRPPNSQLVMALLHPSISLKMKVVPITHQSKSDSQKRRQDENGEKSPDRGDNNPRKRQKLYGGLDMGEGPKWACPFYQREPERYCVETELSDFRKCAKSPGFPQVHRVKYVYCVTVRWLKLIYPPGNTFTSAILRSTVIGATLSLGRRTSSQATEEVLQLVN
jgi:hypothetical protein